MAWHYFRRMGQLAAGEPVVPIAVYRQSERGELQTGVGGIWTTVPGHLAPDDVFLDEITEQDAAGLLASFAPPPAVVAR